MVKSGLTKQFGYLNFFSFYFKAILERCLVGILFRKNSYSLGWGWTRVKTQRGNGIRILVGATGIEPVTLSLEG